MLFHGSLPLDATTHFTIFNNLCCLLISFSPLSIFSTSFSQPSSSFYLFQNVSCYFFTSFSSLPNSYAICLIFSLPYLALAYIKVLKSFLLHLMYPSVFSFSNSFSSLAVQSKLKSGVSFIGSPPDSSHSKYSFCFFSSMSNLASLKNWWSNPPPASARQFLIFLFLGFFFLV